MSSSQTFLPDVTEDISVPTLSNRFRHLVLPLGFQRMMPTRTRRSRAGRKIGILKGFVDLPMDIVFETAMYLDPKDLLQLSRLSKQFRSIFASRSAIFVWRTAFQDLNTKCPSDLNELQFASLIYDKCCMACGCSMMRQDQILLNLRLRLCPRCQTANLISFTDLQNQYQNARNLICHLPASLIPFSEARCFKPEAQLLIEKFLSLKSENASKFILNVEQHTKTKLKDNIPVYHLITPKARTKRSSGGCLRR